MPAVSHPAYSPPWLLTIVAWVMALGIATPTPGQTPDLYFHHLTLADGLSQSINAFVSRDSRGFVWISSVDGLNRYDGVSVRVYRPDPANPNALSGANILSACFEDQRGDLWFGTTEALHRYRRATDDFEHFYFQHREQTIKADYYPFQLDRDGQLWVKTEGKLFLVDTHADLTRPQSEWLHYAGALAGYRCILWSDPARQAKIVFTCDMEFGPGIREYRLEHDSLRLVRRWLDGNAGQPSFKVSCLEPDKNAPGHFWLATEKGLVRWTPGAAHVPVFDDWKGQKITGLRHLVQWTPTLWWVSYREGLILFDTGSRTFLRRYEHDAKNPNSLSTNHVFELYLDAEQNLWVSAWTIGVDYTNLRKPKFQTIAIPDPSEDPNQPFFVPEVLALDPADNTVWCGSRMSSRIVRLSAAGQVERFYNQGRLQPVTLLPLLNGQTLVNSLYQGTFLLDKVNGSVVSICDEHGLSAHGYAFVRNNEQEILASNAEKPGLLQLKIRGKAFQALPLSQPALDTAVWAMLHQDLNGRYYFENISGSIVVFEGRPPNIQPVLTIATGGGEVRCFAENDTAVWVGGDFGLLKIAKQGTHYQFISQKDGLPDGTVYGCLPDGKGHLWLSTNKGLIRYSPADTIFRQYTPADGLQALEYNTRSCLRMPDGRMWFGGILGLNVFHPDSIHDLDIMPKVQITRVRVNDQSFLLDSSITELKHLILLYDQSTLSFEFVALEFSDPHRNRLKYRLEYLNGDPYDKDWVLCQDARGFARYARLRPGQYKFSILGANSDGVWNPEPRTLLVTITPPFWETWWFRSLVLAFLAGLSYLMVRVYVRDKLRRRDLEIREKNLKIEKQEALTQERNRIAGEMHDDLGGGLTSIRMLSERVQDKIEQPETRVQVDKIARYSQDLVQKMGEIIWAMNSNFDTVENLIAYVRRYAVEYLETNQLRPVIREPELIPAATVSGERRRNIYLAVKESLHNIVKHAGATRVNISFEIRDDQLIIQVSDDGRGIDLEQVNQFGNGLHNMRKRLLDIGGDLNIANEDGARLTFNAPIETAPIP